MTPYSYLSYVQSKKNHTHLLFIDFSSAFNCNQPHAHRLLSNFSVVFCLTDFKTMEESLMNSLTGVTSLSSK